MLTDSYNRIIIIILKNYFYLHECKFFLIFFTELARDNLNRLGQYLVIGGIVSPVHEAYGKRELIPGTYRCEMLKLALKSSDWIHISDWECSQETWSRTRRVLQHHQVMVTFSQLETIHSYYFLSICTLLLQHHYCFIIVYINFNLYLKRCHRFIFNIM